MLYFCGAFGLYLLYCAVYYRGGWRLCGVAMWYLCLCGSLLLSYLQTLYGKDLEVITIVT
jgi:hypothetical protein